ncbi:hypothetical protein B0F90DRAFT_1354744 [Multifurca ochricompacta]|uniref:F-box domain-containing protein n=1 Tax=Multifurca ochricompacta TaxID=376703 RepID=A0AAD4LX85_9AGAM|nr:hypothetical protein B0F90DRAFT_1354744 [Multifurca ochricompacta]
MNTFLSLRDGNAGKLLVQIISYLSFKDITSCEVSCRHLNGVVKNSALLRYLKKVGRTGVYDPLNAGFTLPERLERLRLWQKGWEDLDIPRHPRASRSTWTSGPHSSGHCMTGT